MARAVPSLLGVLGAVRCGRVAHDGAIVLDRAERVDPPGAEALVVPRQADVDGRRLQVARPGPGVIVDVAVAPSLPNWLTISAATPAACGEAIDVPWMQPYAPPGSVDRIVVVQSPVGAVAARGGDVGSAEAVVRVRTPSRSSGPSAVMPITPGDSAGTTLHPFAIRRSDGLARSWSEFPSAATGVTPRCGRTRARARPPRERPLRGSLGHLNSVDSWNSSSSTKKLMLITSSFASPA